MGTNQQAGHTCLLYFSFFLSGLATLLANPAYTGIVEWNGVRYPGTHEPLVSPAMFQRVQELLEVRTVRGTRERRHHHYLKGLLVCGVCGRRLSIQRSKGTYSKQSANPAVAADR